MQNVPTVGYISHPQKSRDITFNYYPSVADLPKAIESTMKCFVAILLLVLVAVAMAVEKASETEKTKESDITNVRYKRGYAYHLPYAYSPYAYSAYNLPYAYSTYGYPYNYQYNYPHYNFPYY